MIKSNIFDNFIENKEVSDSAICALHEILTTLLEEYEKSALDRVQESLKEYGIVLDECSKTFDKCHKTLMKCSQVFEECSSILHKNDKKNKEDDNLFE